MLNSSLDFDQRLPCHINAIQLEAIGQLGLSQSRFFSDSPDIGPNADFILLDFLLLQAITPGLVSVLFLYFMDLR